MPTLAEILALAERANATSGDRAGRYIEMKEPQFHRDAIAHARGLFVHAWTFRADDVQVGFADSRAEIRHYLRLGVDGVFTDFVQDAVQAVRGR